MPTPTSVTDDLDDLLGVGPDDMPSSAKTEPPAEEPIEEPSENDEEPEEAPAAETEKPKRRRRTKAEIEAARAAEAAASALPATPDVAALTTEQAQIEYLAQLRAKISGADTTPAATVKPEAALTPLEREIRDAEDMLAAKATQEMASAAPAYEAPQSGNTILIHIVNDGLPINGQMTYRGQEFEFEVGGKAYNQTLDRFGNTFLDLADDVDAQYQKWGEQKIASGPWRGKRVGYTLQDAPREMSQAEKVQWLADMNAHAAAEARRGRAAPVHVGMF